MTDIRFYKTNRCKGIGIRINAKNIERLDPDLRASIESLIQEVEYPRQTKIDEWEEQNDRRIYNRGHGEYNACRGRGI